MHNKLCSSPGQLEWCLVMWLAGIFSPLETISTSLWASLYHHIPVLSVFSHVSCQFVSAQIFSVVVDPSPSRTPPSSLLLICPYRFNRFCLRNVGIWHTLASSCMLWFLTWSFLVLPLIHRSIFISATCNLFSSFFLSSPAGMIHCNVAS